MWPLLFNFVADRFVVFMQKQIPISHSISIAASFSSQYCIPQELHNTFLLRKAMNVFTLHFTSVEGTVDFPVLYFPVHFIRKINSSES